MTSIIEDDLRGYQSQDDELPTGGSDLLDEPDRFEIFMPAVQSLVNALGGYEENETALGNIETIYRPGDSVLAVLKDLKKLWRKDDSDDERTVARCMAKAGLMKELIALLEECTDRGEWGRKVALVACDLMAALTWPIDVQQELKEMEDEPGLVTDYASLLKAQVEYKAMILQTSGPLRCILALILPSLAKPRKDERDERVISLGLHIVRNLLSIRDAVAEGTVTGKKEELANLQSALIIQLNKLTFFQLILTLASCADKTEFNQFNVLVLDILHLVFRSVKPRDLGQDQARAPMENLTKLLDAEKRQRAKQSRAGMTRHSRFGTTIAVKAGDQKLVLHKQNAISVNAGKILDEVKRKRAGKMKKVDELSRVVNISPDAMRFLQGFAKSFIQSCFNAFFASILRDIRMERSKVRDTDNVRCFYLARFFIEYLLILRQKEISKSNDPQGQVGQEAGLSLGLVAEMAEMDSVRWVVMRMKFTMDTKPPAWTELQACLDCFTQILLLIDAMATSNDEEDLEVANILQNQLYYNGDILDSCLLVISQYKDQSVAYLDSVVHFAFVLLRMLEKYSKNKSYMFVRKRKAARRKRKAAEANENGTAPIPEDYDGEDDGEGMEEPDRDAPSYAEHAFTFQAFENRFACEAVVHTLVTYLARFREFDDADQLKRVVNLMHRQVIKTQAEGLYFKVSSLNLFRRVLDEQHSLAKADSSKDLLQLVNFVLRKFFKKVTDDPFVIVQALGPKSRGHWKELSSYKSDDESDDGMGGQKARIQDKMNRPPPELEFKKKKNLSWSQQMGAVVSMLIQAEHRDWIEWIVEFLEIALAARTEIVLAVDGPDAPTLDASDDEGDRPVRNFAGPSKDALEKFQQHDVDAGGKEDRRNALAKDAHFRLMLKLLSFDRTDDEKALDQQWFLPVTIVPSSITASLGALRQYLVDPPTLDDPRSLLRRTRSRVPRVRSGFSSDSDGGDGIQKAPRKRKTAETQIYKSAAFIDDSDDDQEKDKAFFEREKELRREMEVLAEQSGNMLRTGTRKRKRKGKGKENEDGLGMGMGVGGEVENAVEIAGEVTQVNPTQLEVQGKVSDLDSDDGDDEDESGIFDRATKSPSNNLSQSENGDTPLRTQVRIQKSRRIVDSDEDE